MHKQKRGGVHEGGGGASKFPQTTENPCLAKMAMISSKAERVAMLRVRLSNCQIPLLFYNVSLQRLLTTKTPGVGPHAFLSLKVTVWPVKHKVTLACSNKLSACPSNDKLAAA